MTEVPDITGRVRATEARIAQISGQRSAGSAGTGRLGFAQALEHATAEVGLDGGLDGGLDDPVAAALTPPAPIGSAGSSPVAGGPVPASLLDSVRSTHDHDHHHDHAPGRDNGRVEATSGLTPADPTAGGYGRLEPPAELLGYGNGRIPAEALVEIGVGRHRLHGPAADAFVGMRAEAEAQGIDIGITDSYRPLDVQERLVEEKGLYSQGGLAARPGTSNHGWGLSVDLDLDADALAWMRGNAWRFGFVEDVPREPWHWTYRPVE